jgi:hypothetical protein
MLTTTTGRHPAPGSTRTPETARRPGTAPAGGTAPSRRPGTASHSASGGKASRPSTRYRRWGGKELDNTPASAAGERKGRRGWGGLIAGSARALTSLWAAGCPTRKQRFPLPPLPASGTGPGRAVSASACHTVRGWDRAVAGLADGADGVTGRATAGAQALSESSTPSSEWDRAVAGLAGLPAAQGPKPPSSCSAH